MHVTFSDSSVSFVSALSALQFIVRICNHFGARPCPSSFAIARTRHCSAAKSAPDATHLNQFRHAGLGRHPPPTRPNRLAGAVGRMLGAYRLKPCPVWTRSALTQRRCCACHGATAFCRFETKTDRLAPEPRRNKVSAPFQASFSGAWHDPRSRKAHRAQPHRRAPPRESARPQEARQSCRNAFKHDDRQMP